jgi:hypothetical protein
MNKSVKEKSDDLRRKELISYLKKNGYSSLEYEENQIYSISVSDIDQNKIRDAIVLFLNSLNIQSGSNSNFDFYSLLLKYISDKEIRQKINKML